MPQAKQSIPVQMSDEYGYMMPQEADTQNDPNSIYTDMMREERVSNLIEQINPDNLLSDIENRIRGKVKNKITHQWEAYSKDAPQISDLLVANFMSYLGCILNQNTSMSNFSAGEINNLMENVVDYIRDDLSVNARKYGIEGNYQEMTRIGNIVCMTVFTVLKRAQNGMEARRIFGALRIAENLTQPKQSKGSGWDSLAFWK